MILIISIVIRTAAFIWSLALLKRIRDWRMGLLTAALMLMALRQLMTTRALIRGQGLELWTETSVQELPGLMVSVLAALFVYHLGHMILDERKAAEQLRDREAMLMQAQKMEALGRLAGGTAHDFNNLLTVILGNLELAKNSLTDPDTILEAIDEAETASFRAADLTRQILAFSRQQALDRSVFDLNDAARTLDRMLRRLLGHDVELVTLPIDCELPIDADRAQIEQVLMNIAVNSRDAMPHGGTLTIELERTEVAPDSALARSVPPGNHAVVRIRDTGTGMNDEVLRQALDPFFTTKGLGQGTGLGLSSALGIVEGHGGKLLLASAEGRGTTVTIYLPLAESTNDNGGIAPSLETGSQGTETILLVEDEAQIRRLAHMALVERGYAVVEATNGGEALQAAAEVRPALLITDVVMPLMGGIELAMTMRADQPDLPVLFTSGYVEPPSLAELDGATNISFLQKPFAGEALAVKVRSILDRQPSNEAR